MEKIKKIIKANFFKHKIKQLKIEDNFLIVDIELFNNPGTKYFVLKDRKSGRRFQVPITDNKIKVSLDELADVNDDGVFDIYVKTHFLNKIIWKRTPFNSNIKLINYVDRKNKNELKVYRTKKYNLTITSKAIVFTQEIKEINLTNEGFTIVGKFEDFEKKNPTHGQVNLVRRDTRAVYSFPININPKDAPNTYTFDCDIQLNSLADSLVTNSRWDASLQLRDEDNNVIYSDLINLQSYKEFPREELRYLLEFENDEENLTALYATVGRNSLALWYTDKNQFQRTYNIARGKSVFNEVALTEPLDEKMVFFESFFGKNYSGNPKYVYEEMLRDPSFRDFTFVWSYTGNHPEVIPGNAILVDRETEEYYRYLAKAKYWVSNILFPVHKKREGNVYLQTWHGTPLKRLGFDIEIEGPETLARENFYSESRNWDYLIAANHYSDEIFKRAFKFDKEMLTVGYPANDVFYRDNQDEKVAELKKKLGIPLNKKVILYAPTWRDDEMVGSWKHGFNLKFDLNQFYELFNEDYVLVLRMHHLISEGLQIDEAHKSFVYDLSHFDDIQELYLMSNVLITDYSSVFFDFANSKRPILFYAYDFENYKDNIRGFYLDMETELPGPVLRTEEELFNAIQNIEGIQEQYKQKYEEFYAKFCSLEDGNAGARVIQKVFKKN